MTELIVDAPDLVALIGGAQLGPQHLNILQTLTQTFVAADSGADHLRAAGIVPEAVIGDFDSLSDESRREFLPQSYHVPTQDTTDLEKVLSRVCAPIMVGAGFLGGRIDHSFASFNALARFTHVPLVLLSDTECCFRAPDDRWQIDLPVDTPFSVLPMGPCVASSKGLVWDMDQLPLSPVGFVSSSNMTRLPQVSVQTNGPAIVTLPLAHLSAAIDVVRAR